jgi:hypothetical protein
MTHLHHVTYDGQRPFHEWVSDLAHRLPQVLELALWTTEASRAQLELDLGRSPQVGDGKSAGGEAGSAEAAVPSTEA